MSNATIRLKETMHMYNQMITSPVNNQEIFFANLQSFLALARSVTQVMQKECNKITGFKEWYSIKQERMKNDPDMRFLLEMRNKSLKEKSVGNITINFNLPEKITLKPKEKMLFPAVRYTGEGFVLDEKKNVVVINDIPRPDIKFETTMNYQFTEKPNTDAKILCLEHFKKLSKLVEEYDEKFSEDITRFKQIEFRSEKGIKKGQP